MDHCAQLNEPFTKEELMLIIYNVRDYVYFEMRKLKHEAGDLIEISTSDVLIVR